MKWSEAFAILEKYGTFSVCAEHDIIIVHFDAYLNFDKQILMSHADERKLREFGFEFDPEIEGYTKFV